MDSRRKEEKGGETGCFIMFGTMDLMRSGPESNPGELKKALLALFQILKKRWDLRRNPSQRGTHHNVSLTMGPNMMYIFHRTR